MDNNSSIDCFTNLTNSLLLIIISFLPFREAVRTSVLSSRWRHLWKETTNIEFNENFFVDHNKNEENQRVRRIVFFNFAKQFIANYPQMAIQKLSVVCSKPQEFLPDIQSIVFFGTSRNVKELGLNFVQNFNGDDHDDLDVPLLELPLSVYQLRQLESLKLFSCNFDDVKFINFNVLKSVSLGWMQLDIGTIKNVLIHCPQLESLSLTKCWDIDHFEITMPNLRLKNLVLDKCEFDRDWFFLQGPKFHSFKYSGKLGQFYMEDQPFLVEVDLEFGMDVQFDETWGTILYDFLLELYAVQTLKVCSVFLQLIPNGEEPIKLQTPLNNVRQLTLKTALHSYEFCGIKFMLRSCPVLEKLTIDLGPETIFHDYSPPHDFNPREFWSKNLIVEPCIKGTLKIVDVKGFKGTSTEIHFLIYIIHFGRVLEELNIYLAGRERGNGDGRETICMQIAQRFMQLPKASPNLRISVFMEDSN